MHYDGVNEVLNHPSCNTRSYHYYDGPRHRFLQENDSAEHGSPDLSGVQIRYVAQSRAPNRENLTRNHLDKTVPSA